MRRFSARILLLAVLLAAAGACGSDDDPITGPPPPTNVTEQFSDILTLNGARVYSFTVAAAGGITALLTELSPDNPVGLSLGTWNGSICQIVLDNPSSKQGSVVVGQTTTTGTYCVRIYDATGSVTQPQSFTIEVSYPGASGQ